jgi:hypothetical protein
MCKIACIWIKNVCEILLVKLSNINLNDIDAFMNDKINLKEHQQDLQDLDEEIERALRGISNRTIYND